MMTLFIMVALLLMAALYFIAFHPTKVNGLVGGISEHAKHATQSVHMPTSLETTSVLEASEPKPVTALTEIDEALQPGLHGQFLYMP